MTPDTALFNNAVAAWQQWHMVSFAYRKQQIEGLKSQLKKSHKPLARLTNFHLQHAEQQLAMPVLLAGITGETNQLYTQGRGVCLLVVQNNSSHSDNVTASTVAMLITALVAGNSVILCTDNTEINQLVSLLLTSINLPTNLIQLCEYDNYAALINHNISTVGYVGNHRALQQLNKQLADKPSAIANLIYETQLETPRLVHDPLLSLSFITERVKTINIAAIGGNAELLSITN